ncbi:DUF2802 domain-containing protein [Gilvimarinus sp. SDUM040013]|uniref:DUF2802 domain-containing protein n=1 Tax=Gilvimarinus gilvus TaxID=3058038 RepID=A0ABU4RU62_9GAMM|nr:DUF2802 domain-containing protein [Gilvimarinus sp. SDUM040013]MDO3385032.1 DUF2802 domain-containing protein [Gilvimarinus sp. SDUM040013]MDX6848407.1 DUF2802 domain-containing protein [Gilvimarinus sp. SDUM040013]
MTDSHIILWVAGAAALLAVTACAWCCLLSRRNISLHIKITEVEKELSSLKAGAIGMGQRILAMEGSVSPRSPAPQSDVAVNSRPYSEATHLLEKGISRDEVASRCGLSRAEASLLDALRKKPTS